MLRRDRLETLLRACSRLTIGLVGEVRLDTRFHVLPGAAGVAERVADLDVAAGGMGLVLRQLAALNVGLLVPCSVLGDDGAGYALLQAIKRWPVDPSHLLCFADRQTAARWRLVSGESAESARDWEFRPAAPLSPDHTRLLCRHVGEVFHSSDGLVVCDAGGEANVVNGAVRARLTELAGEAPRKRVVAIPPPSRSLAPEEEALAAVVTAGRAVALCAGGAEEEAAALARGMAQLAGARPDESAVTPAELLEHWDRL